MPAWRSSRRGSFFAIAAPFFGRPRLRFAVLGAGAGVTGFSRASMAVASREMCPTRRSLWVLLIRASCTRLGKALAANSAKAREKVLSLGTAPARSQPHSRRSPASAASRSIRPEVVAKLSMAFAVNARASAWRSFCGRPGRPGHVRTKASILARSRTTTSRSCCAVSGPTSSRSIGKRKP